VEDIINKTTEKINGKIEGLN
jgi:hypothetical protein